MPISPFLLPFERLPMTLPLFPLSDAVVMPECQLPLNIFEPRYLNMVFDAMGGDRLIGMIQPHPANSDPRHPTTFTIGTAGRIISFSETPDGRLLIVLSGVCRFHVTGEIPTTRGYRRASVEWGSFRVDYESSQTMQCSREQWSQLLREYFAVNKLEIDWEAVAQLDDLALCNLLIGALPWAAAERQTLIEAVTLNERVEKLIGLLQFAVSPAVPSSVKHH